MIARALSYIVFTDFDGTITANDIGDALFRRYGDSARCDDLFRKYRAGELTARECWTRECETVETLTREEILSFVAAETVDRGFHSFVSFCEAQGIPLIVLSDGFGTYIDEILRRERLTRLPVFSNELLFRADGSIVPSFPYTDSECVRCANCKRNHLLTRSRDDQVIVYIGDGTSDECPVRYADVVFAKDALVGVCERENITYHRFVSFYDVLNRFRTILESGRPRKRRAAELARKEAFMNE